MAESTLSLTNVDIAKEVGFLVGYTRDSSAWTNEQKQNLEACLDSGYRQFLVPPPINGRVHEWTFMRPITTLTIWPDVAVTAGVTVTQSGYTLTANTATFYPSMVGRTVVITGQSTNRTITAYTNATTVTVSVTQTIASGATFSIASEGRFRLADDFGGMDGLVTFSANSNQYCALPLVNELAIREVEQQNTIAGKPVMCAVVANNAAGTTGQRFDLAVSPKPDALYTLKFRYNANPGSFATLSSSTYPLGGMNHSETLKESCMAIAEETLMDGGSAIHINKFRERLAASVEWDVRTMTPEYLGYNRDSSDWKSKDRPMQSFYVTYNGAIPT